MAEKKPTPKATAKTEAPSAAPAPQTAPATTDAPQKSNNTKVVVIVVSIVVFLFIIVPMIFILIGAVLVKDKLKENGVNIDSGGKSITVKDDNGNTFSAGGQTSLPSDFPEGMTLYSKNITSAGRATFEGKTTWTVSIETNDSVQTVTNALKNTFSQNGWSIEMENSTNEGSYINATNGTLRVNTFTASNNGKTTIVYTVSQE